MILQLLGVRKSGMQNLVIVVRHSDSIHGRGRIVSKGGNSGFFRVVTKSIFLGGSQPW